jgi:CubicO group peptidase (beta-lactamase class C family)
MKPGPFFRVGPSAIGKRAVNFVIRSTRGVSASWLILLGTAGCTEKDPTSGDDSGDEHAGDSAADTDPTDDTGPEDGPEPCPGTGDTFAEVVAFMEAELTANGVPGGAIAIVCDGALLHSAGVGVAHYLDGGAITADTRFQLASVTKMFTAAAAVSLDESGVVDLHAPIETWVPDTPITLHQLLTHTSGYPGWFSDGVWTSYDLDQFFANNADQPLWSPPGAVYNYSNNGYGLAGLVLQEAADKPFADLVAERVFAPAGMDRATLHADEVLAGEDYATGHSGDPANPTLLGPDSSYLPTGYYGPMGGAWGSVHDLALWALVHLDNGGDVMSAASHAGLITPHTMTHAYPEEAMGYGVFIDQLSEPDVLDHSGGVAGFLSHWTLIPDTGFGVFVLVNADTYWPGTITDYARAAYGVSGEVDLGPYSIDESDFSLFEGTYSGNSYLGEITVQQTASGLEATFLDSGATSPLVPYWSDLFVMSWAGQTMSAVLWRDSPEEPAKYLVTGSGVSTRTDD